MAGRYPRVPTSGAAHGDFGCERLLSCCRGRRRHTAARVWRRVGAGAPTRDVVRQHCCARHRALVGERQRRLKFLISRNFYTHRYDYRIEWLKFIELVSEPKVGEELSVRIIRALAEFVDSPAGVLWSLSRGIGYYPTAAWKQRIPADCKLPIDDPFVFGFRNGGWIQARSSEAGENTWPIASDKAWLAVPLSHRTEVIGFVVLDRANRMSNPDWEAFDLLRAAGRQAA